MTLIYTIFILIGKDKCLNSLLLIKNFTSQQLLYKSHLTVVLRKLFLFFHFLFFTAWVASVFGSTRVWIFIHITSDRNSFFILSSQWQFKSSCLKLTIILTSDTTGKIHLFKNIIYSGSKTAEKDGTCFLPWTH